MSVWIRSADSRPFSIYSKNADFLPMKEIESSPILCRVTRNSMAVWRLCRVQSPLLLRQACPFDERKEEEEKKYIFKNTREDKALSPNPPSTENDLSDSTGVGFADIKA